MNSGKRHFLNEDHMKISAGMTDRPYKGPNKESIRGLTLVIDSLKKTGYQDDCLEIKRLQSKINELKKS